MRLTLLIILLGGTVAVIGNYVGRLIGRRRLSILNLRPRHTATAITILSGILIALMTLGILLIVSQDARTAIFGLEKMKLDLASKKEELARLDRQLTVSQKSIASLNTVRRQLKQEVEVSRIGDVTFKIDDILLTSVIVAGPEEGDLIQGLKQILSAADLYVRNFGDVADKQLVNIRPENFDQAVDRLKSETGDFIVSVVVLRNTIFGETVPVRFELAKNRLIYPAGQEISQLFIPATDSQAKNEQSIRDLLTKTNQIARRAGVVPNPDGSMGSLPYATILETAKTVKSIGRSVTIKTLAEKDIYAIGPLTIKIKILYQ